MKTLVISDLHIGSKGCKTDEILELLKDESYLRYILVGDIIDGWLFQKYKKFSYQHTKVIRRLLKLSKDKEIIWISGNHDEFLRKYTPIELGNIKVVDEFIENGIWFCHGDKYDGIIKMHWLGMLGSIGYDMALWINRWYNRYRTWRGLPYHSISQQIKEGVKVATTYVNDFEVTAIKMAQKHNCYGVICGHIHQPADRIIDGAHYLNSGDWVENLTAVLLDNQNKFTIFKL